MKEEDAGCRNVGVLEDTSKETSDSDTVTAEAVASPCIDKCVS